MEALVVTATLTLGALLVLQQGANVQLSAATIAARCPPRAQLTIHTVFKSALDEKRPRSFPTRS
jgi:hypothetical protein